MRNVWLICRRELASFFFSPIAYVVLAAWSLLLGVFYSGSFLNYAVISLQIMRNPQAAARLNLTPTSAVLGPVFSSTTIVLLFVIPLLTMRLFSEEKKEGTMELLLTYPLRNGELLMGKYLSVLLMYMIMLAITGLYPIILSAFTSVEWGVVGAGYLGMLLLGSAFLSVGLLASSLTSNQIVGERMSSLSNAIGTGVGIFMFTGKVSATIVGFLGAGTATGTGLPSLQGSLIESSILGQFTSQGITGQYMPSFAKAIGQSSENVRVHPSPHFSQSLIAAVYLNAPAPSGNSRDPISDRAQTAVNETLENIRVRRSKTFATVAVENIRAQQAKTSATGAIENVRRACAPNNNSSPRSRRAG